MKAAPLAQTACAKFRKCCNLSSIYYSLAAGVDFVVHNAGITRDRTHARMSQVGPSDARESLYFRLDAMTCEVGSDAPYQTAANRCVHRDTHFTL